MRAGLKKDLQKYCRSEIYFNKSTRALYAMEAANSKKIPLGVVIPTSVEEIAMVVQICASYGVPIVHFGGGTSLGRKTVSQDAIIIDSSKYCNRIIRIDAEKKIAIVEPGVVINDLRQAANLFGLTLGPDTSIRNFNTFGSMIGNSACGECFLATGRTAANVHDLEVLTYDGLRLNVGLTTTEQLAQYTQESGRKGEIYRRLTYIRDTYADEIRTRFSKIPCRVWGYNLDELLPENGFHVARALVGTENTCVTVLRAAVSLIADPPCKILLILGFDNVTAAAGAVTDVLSFNPLTLHSVDETLIQFMRKKNYQVEGLKYLPDGKGWLIAQFGGENDTEVCQQAARLKAHIKKNSQFCGLQLLSDVHQMQLITKIREVGLGSTAWLPSVADGWLGWEDFAVTPENFGIYIHDLQSLLKQYGYNPTLYGHFGGDLIHLRINFALHVLPEAQKLRRFMEEAAVLVASYGGTSATEHENAQVRAELFSMYGPKLMQAFAEFKQIWDPANKMNPGRLITPKPLDEDLRYDQEYFTDRNDAFSSRTQAAHFGLRIHTVFSE